MQHPRRLKSKSPPRVLALLVAVLLSVNGFNLVLPALATHKSPTGYAPLPSDIPSILNTSTPVGFPKPGTPMTVSFTLPTRDVQGLSQFLKAVDNPKSPYYKKFLNDQQFAALYGPDAKEFKTLEAYLQSYGLSTGYNQTGSSGFTNPNLFVLKASGTVQQVEQALNTHVLVFSRNGTNFYSATTPPSLPGEFSNVIKVGGLSNFKFGNVGKMASPSGTVQAQSGPERSSSGLQPHEAVPLYRTLYQKVNSPSQTPGNFMYYSPSEIEQMYNLTSLAGAGVNGTGVTIAIVDAYGDPYIQQELNEFDSWYGIPNQNISVICVDGPCYYSSGLGNWNTEIALDVEWAHALAPAAKINLYIASDSGGALYDAVEAAVLGTNGTTPVSPSSIISLSWGLPENDIGSSASTLPYGWGNGYPWLNQVFQQAAAEGITVFAATGDWGAYDQSYDQTSPYGGAIYPSTDPFVTGVGGTSLYANVSSGFLQYPYYNATAKYGAETGWSWNGAYGWATGGGCSTLFGAQDWELWQGNPTSCQEHRGAPDVAWDGDVQTGVVVDVNHTGYIVGGTSVGAPSWAGVMALVDQTAGKKLGLINPALYAMNLTEYSKTFHDVTVGNNNPLSASRYWDPLTGLGSPNVGNLARYLASPGVLPVGGLSVAVKLGTSSPWIPLGLSQTLGSGATLGIEANVTNAGVNVTEGTVQATVAEPGHSMALVSLSYNSTTGLWGGTYALPTPAEAGEWSVSVNAVNGTLRGGGFATFSAGDGISFGIYTCWGCFYVVGNTIDVDAVVTAPGGSDVTSGNYSAGFNLGGPNGPSEGNISLYYNWSDHEWEGSFWIPYDAGQGAWTMTVTGEDGSSNLGSTYTWINVGLPVFPDTDNPTYLVGDDMGISASTGAPAGSFNATISSHGAVLGTVPLTFSGLLDGDWYGNYVFGGQSAAGFDVVSVSGGDSNIGGTNYGNFSTVVRVAPDSLNVNVAVSKPQIAVNDSSCVYNNYTLFYDCMEMVSAQVSYQNGTAVTQGNVEAFVSLEGPVEDVSTNYAVLTYNSAAKAFVGYVEVPAIGPHPYLLANGWYFVDVVAFDPLGNTGQGSAEYLVYCIPHAPIHITSSENFTYANGVVAGNGSTANPYLIEGWYTTQIEVAGSMNSSYIVVDNWVQPSTGDGIILNTPNVLIGDNNPLAWYNFELGGPGNGLQLANTPNIWVGPNTRNVWVGYNMAGWNEGNGVLINGSEGASVLVGSQSAGNGANGVEFLNTEDGQIHDTMDFGNNLNGILFLGSPYSAVSDNVEAFNIVGINDTGSSINNAWLNSEFMNNVGVFVNGQWQGTEEPGLSVKPMDGEVTSSSWNWDDAESNGIGLLAVNNAFVGSWDSSYIGNGQGVVSNSSTLVLEWGTEAYNSGAGVSMNGMATDNIWVGGDCSGWSDWSNVVDCNFAYMNGHGDGDPAPNLSVNDMWGLLLFDNEGVSSGGNDTQFNDVGETTAVDMQVTNSGGNGYSLYDSGDLYFGAVYSGPSQWCQRVCNLILPGATSSGFSLDDGGWVEVTDSYFFGNGGGGASFNWTYQVWLTGEWDYNGFYQNTGPGVSVSNSMYFWIDSADVEENMGNGVQIHNSNFTTLTDSYMYYNANVSSPLTFGIDVSQGSVNTTVTYNDVEYHWGGIGFQSADNSTATNNYICHNFVGIYIDQAINGTYAPNTFCSNNYNIFTNPPVDGSYTIVSTGAESVGTTKAFYANISNNLLYKPSAIIWFEVDNARSQEVMVVGVSLDIASMKTGSAYLALSTLPPGTYNIRAFVVTEGGIPLSNVVTTAATVS